MPLFLPATLLGAIDQIHSELTVIQSSFESNFGVIKGGGISAWLSSTLRVQRSQFTTNRAQQGAALDFESGCLVTVIESAFRNNEVSVSGGAIALSEATIHIEISTFVGNVASGVGASVYIDRPHSVMIKDTQFSPFMDGADTVFIAGRAGDCNQHPCDQGQSCSYANYSLSCTPCEGATVSTDGIQCIPCFAGEGPFENATGCAQCLVGKFSSFGQCFDCPAGKKSSADFVTCDACPVESGLHIPAGATQCETCQRGKVPTPTGDSCILCKLVKLTIHSTIIVATTV
eukprot:SAG22_NODE_482_length_9931_cov_9.247254_5_plen_288_part_00